MRKLMLCALVALLAVPAAGQVQDETGATGVYTPDRTATATLGALNAAATILVTGRQGVGGYLALGTLAGTVTPEVTVDGSTWVATSFLAWSAGAAPTRAATIAASTLFQLELPAGTKRARIRVSSYSSGSGTGTLIATEAPGVAGAGPTQPVSGTVGVSGTVATDPTDEDARVLGRVKIHDGTDTALVSAAGALLTDASAATQPVSAASLPLPTGAATAALQDGIVRDGVGDTTQANVSGGRVHVDGSGVTQPVSAASLPLPTGASTSAEQATQTASLSVLDDWDETNRAAVNPIVGQAGVAAGSGDASASTVRVAEAGAPSIAYAQVSCATTATLVAAARAGRRAIGVTLLAGGTDLYLGDASVTTASGDLLLGVPGAARSYPTSAALYCRVAAGSVSVSFVEVF